MPGQCKNHPSAGRLILLVVTRPNPNNQQKKTCTFSFFSEVHPPGLWLWLGGSWMDSSIFLPISLVVWIVRRIEIKFVESGTTAWTQVITIVRYPHVLDAGLQLKVHRKKAILAKQFRFDLCQKKKFSLSNSTFSDAGACSRRKIDGIEKQSKHVRQSFSRCLE